MFTVPHAQEVVVNWIEQIQPDRDRLVCLSKLVTEEVPELCIALKNEDREAVKSELADCFILLLDLAHLAGVDLDEAFREKMALNGDRTWRVDQHGLLQHVKSEEEPENG